MICCLLLLLSFNSRLLNFINIHLFHDDDNIIALQGVSDFSLTACSGCECVCLISDSLLCSLRHSIVAIVRWL